jgi:replicative DNA helicase
MPANDNLPAVNLEAERSALGAFIEDHSIFDAALAIGLIADEFCYSDHRRIFSALLDMREKRLPVDLISVAEHLGNSESDYALLADLVFGVVVESSHILHHVRIIRKNAKLRKLLMISDWLQLECREPGADPDSLTSQFIGKLELDGMQV